MTTKNKEQKQILENSDGHNRSFTRKLLGICSFVVIAASVLRLISVIDQPSSLTFKYSVSYALTGFLTLLWVQYGKLKLAQWFLFTIMATSITYFNFEHGKTIGSDFGLLALIVLSAVLFKSRRDRNAIVVLIFGLFVVSQIFQIINGPIEPKIDVNSAYTIRFIIVALILALVIRLYMEQILQQLNKLKLLSKRLNQKSEAISYQNNTLEAVNQELEKFIYVAAHDLKTPLRNINSFVDLEIRQNKLADSDYNPEFLRLAKENSMQLYNLVNDILEYSKLQNNPQSNWNDLNQIIDSISEQYQNKQENSVLIFSGDLPQIFADSSHLMILFQSIIENGVKYNSTAVPTIRIHSKETKEATFIYISDNGIGIDKEYHNKIFNMFTRLHSVSEYKGTGIGLAACKNICERLGAKISVQSSNISGTTISLEFPNDILKFKKQPSVLSIHG